MADTIIDSLVVTLGLKPQDFTKGVKDASAAQTKFTAGVTDLTKKEGKLNEAHKNTVKALRDSAVNAERAKKEMAAASVVGKELWGVLEKGALSFGAALGVAGFAEMAKDAVVTNAAISRLSATLGMGARDADTWGKAIEAKVNGNATEALGTIQRLNTMLIRMGSAGEPPLALIRTLALVAANTGISVPLVNANRTPRSITDIIHDLSPAVRQMGQEKSTALLGDMFDQGSIRFMGLSDNDQRQALAEARSNTPGGPDPYGDAAKLQTETTNLTQAFGALRDTVMLISAPDLIAGVKGLTSWLQWFRDPSADPAGNNRNARVQRGDLASLGSAKVAQEIVSHLPIPGDSQIPDNWWGRIASGLGIQVVKNPKSRAWSQADELSVAQSLLDQQVDPADVRAMILHAEASGIAPSAVKASMKNAPPLGVGSMDSVLDAIRDQGEHSGNFAVSPKGALGRYQFMPDTAAQYGLTDPTNEGASREAARRYLTHLYSKFGSMDKAVAAYNMGEGALGADIAINHDNWRSFVPHETASYLDRVVGAGGGGGGVQVTVNGPTTINTKATDGEGVRRAWTGHWALVAQAQTGQH